jgi:hypothetical protein
MQTMANIVSSHGAIALVHRRGGALSAGCCYGSVCGVDFVSGGAGEVRHDDKASASESESVRDVYGALTWL